MRAVSDIAKSGRGERLSGAWGPCGRGTKRRLTATLLVRRSSRVRSLGRYLPRRRMFLALGRRFDQHPTTPQFTLQHYTSSNISEMLKNTAMITTDL